MCEKQFTTLLTSYNASYQDNYAKHWGSLVHFIEGEDSFTEEAQAYRNVRSLYNSIESPKIPDLRPLSKHKPSQSMVYSRPIPHQTYTIKPHVRTFRNQPTVYSKDTFSHIVDRSM